MMLEVLFFNEGGTRNNTFKKSTSFLESNFQEWRKTAPSIITQPSIELLVEILKNLTTSKGVSSIDITFDQFMQPLIQSVSIFSYLSPRYRPFLNSAC